MLSNYKKLLLVTSFYLLNNVLREFPLFSIHKLSLSCHVSCEKEEKTQNFYIGPNYKHSIEHWIFFLRAVFLREQFLLLNNRMEKLKNLEHMLRANNLFFTRILS